MMDLLRYAYFIKQLYFNCAQVSLYLDNSRTSPFDISAKPGTGNDVPVHEGASRHMLRRSTKQVDEATVKVDLIPEGSAAGGVPHRELQGVTLNGINWRFGESAVWAMDCDFKDKGDYKQVYNTQGSQCDPICRADPSCTNFAWSQGTCYLKKGGFIYSDATRLSPGSGVVCGVRNIDWQQSFTASWAQDCDFTNMGDYKQVYKTQGEQCDPLCVSDSSCTSFAWSRADGTCYLKNGKVSTFDARKLPGSGVTCGVKKPTGWQSNPFSKTITQWNCDFPNMGDYKQVYNQPTLACGSFCNADSKCTHYTWSYGTCYLKTGGAKTSDARTGTSYYGAFCAIKG